MYQGTDGAVNCNLRLVAAARHMGLSAATLAKWRCVRGGPPYTKLGRAVVYSLRDLDSFVASRGKRRSTSDGAAA
jgi:hypothetical protein